VKINLPSINPTNLKDLESAKAAILELMNCFEQLMTCNNQLLKENHQLKNKIAKLENRPGSPTFPSQNSSSFSSKDESKQTTSKKWSKSKKKGKIEIDQKKSLPEVSECSCGSTRFKILRTRQKITQGIIIKRNNTLWTGNDKQCLNCGQMHLLSIPQNIKYCEFDDKTRTWISIFKHDMRMTEPLIHRFLTGMGLHISKGQITNIRLGNSHRLIKSHTHLINWGIKTADYLHTDATGAKRKSQTTGKILNHHLHFLGNQIFSLFKITNKYNSNTMAFKVLGKRGRRKILISDDHSANGGKLPIRDKQLCWIHEIRHYRKLDPHIHLHQQEVKQIQDQLWQFYNQAKVYGRDPTKAKQQQLENQFEQIIHQEVNYAKLQRRLQLTAKKKARLLTFLKYPQIPIHNNLAEQNLREAVIQRKISHETKSKAGDTSIARHLSIIQTIRKQKLNLFDTFHGLLNDQISPFVLTAKINV